MKITKGVFAFVLCLLAFETEAKFVDVNSFMLDNGLSVYVVENHKSPIIESRLYYKVGSLNDEVGKGGIAHLLEHMMFRGTKRIKSDEFNNIVEENGVSNNAYTTLDHTTYYEFMGVDKLELMLAIEADRMTNLEMKDEDFLKERDVVLQERKQRFETNSSTLFYENLNSLLWQGGALSNPVSGREKEIENLTKDDAYKFYNKYYGVDNAILVLAGDINIEEAREVVNKHFGKIKAKNIKKEEDRDVIKEVKSQIKMKLKGVKVPRYAKLIRLDKNSLNKKEQLALSVLLEYLTGDDTAIVYDKLVYKDKKFLSVNIDASYYEQYGGDVSISVVLVNNEMDIDEIGNVVNDAIDFAIDNLEVKNLDEIKNLYLSNAIYLADDLQSVAGFVGGMVVDGYDAKDIREYDEMIRNISIEDVKNVYLKVFDKKLSYVVGYLEGDDDEN